MKSQRTLLVGMLMGILLLSGGCARVAVSARQSHLQGIGPEEMKCVRLRDQIAASNTQVLTNAYQRDFLKSAQGFNLSPQNGMCFSGGGLRSSLVSMGAMRALHKMGYLEKADVISTVSGGSYALSWYLANIKCVTNDHRQLLEEVGFQKTICKMEKRCFCPWYDCAKHSYVFRLLWFGQMWSYYGNCISDYYDLNGKSITDAKLIANNNPLYIYNATIEQPGLDSALEKDFEFTQRYCGSDSLGYHNYKPRFMTNLAELSATSGAAVSFSLRHRTRVQTPFGGVVKVPLADGGHNENLGLLALVKRGVANILVVDAEEDELCTFGGYWNLKKILKQEMGLDISVPGIECLDKKGPNFSSTFLFSGSITNLFIKSPVSGEVINYPIRITYLKLGVPSEKLWSQLCCGNGTNLYPRLRNLLFKKNLPQLDSQLGLTEGGCTINDCLKNAAEMKLGCHDEKFPSSDYSEDVLMCSGVEKYSDFWKRRWKWRTWERGYFFPQTRTLDQSYFMDQTRAFMSLGYLMGLSTADVFIPENTK